MTFRPLLLALSTLLLSAAGARAQESLLVQTYQPLNGLGSGEIVVSPVMCHDYFATSGVPNSIALIGAKNVSPTNAPVIVANVNLAYSLGIILKADEAAPGTDRIRVTIDVKEVDMSDGNDVLQAFAATLECLRLVAGPRLAEMELVLETAPKEQAPLTGIFERFKAAPKDVEFPWRTTN